MRHVAIGKSRLSDVDASGTAPIHRGAPADAAREGARDARAERKGRAALLGGFLTEATLAGVGRPFHSLKRNCLTELLRIMDKVKPFDQGLIPDGVLPHAGELELKKRGLIGADLGRADVSELK